MQDKVHIVQKHPLCLGVAFYAVRPLARFGHLLLHVISNRLYLARVGAGTDDKIISECSTAFVHLQDDDIVTLFAFNGPNRLRNLLPGV